MGSMAAQPPQPEDLTTLTLEAVRALLKQIASGAYSSPGGSSSATQGTYASFAAQALRDLMGCPPLAQIVDLSVGKELKAAAGR